MRTQSFSHSAAKIYNSLPRHLKRKQALEENFDRVRVVEEFKKQLDNFLTTLPDQPTTPGLTRGAAETNSMVGQVNYIEDQFNIVKLFPVVCCSFVDINKVLFYIISAVHCARMADVRRKYNDLI